MPAEKILFICIHNSARSQMAEAYLKHLAGEEYEVMSAGLEPGRLNPAVVKVMKEEGIDISGNRTKSVKQLFDRGLRFDKVIAVCDKASAQKCPVFPGAKEQIHWTFEDPSAAHGTEEEKMEKARIIRDQIKHRIERWLKESSRVRPE